MTVHVLVTNYEGDLAIYSGTDLPELIQGVIESEELPPFAGATLEDLTRLLAGAETDLAYHVHYE